MITVGALAQRIGPLFDLHGQHEHQALLAPATQLSYLDRFIGAEAKDKSQQYQQAWQHHRECLELLEQLRVAAKTSAATLEQAEFTVREIGAVDPQPDEYQQIEQQLPRLRNGEQLAQVSGEAYEALRGDGGILDTLSVTLRNLTRVSGFDGQLDHLYSQLESAAISIEDIGVELRAYRDGVEFDPAALQQALDRLGQLEGLRRRFGPRMEDVFNSLQEAEKTISMTGDIDGRLQVAEQSLLESEEALQHAAERLVTVREQGSSGFIRAISAAVQDLAMTGASFELSTIALKRENWTKSGSCHYELLFKPSANSTPRPLAKIASGGELSRVMLALKTLLQEDSGAVALVFDEIDSGIGGATAIAIAQRLRQLAESHQVIVVTHLAQIAATADCHLVVTKYVNKGQAHTRLDEVTSEGRIEEIARMLSGSVDPVALEHARRLLNEAV